MRTEAIVPIIGQNTEGGVSNALIKHKSALIIAWILIILILGYEITNFTLSVDEQRESTHSAGTMDNIDTINLWETQGRYSTTVLKHIISTDGVFTPYVDTLIAILGIAAAAVINIISFEKCCGKRFKTASWYNIHGTLLFAAICCHGIDVFFNCKCRDFHRHIFIVLGNLWCMRICLFRE